MSFDLVLLMQTVATMNLLLSKDSVEVQQAQATLGLSAGAAYVPFALTEYIKNSAVVQPLNTLAVVPKPRFEVTTLALSTPVSTFRFDNRALDYADLTCITASCNRTQSSNGKMVVVTASFFKSRVTHAFTAHSLPFVYPRHQCCAHPSHQLAPSQLRCVSR
jgi:hypothetical protein